MYNTLIEVFMLLYFITLNENKMLFKLFLSSFYSSFSYFLLDSSPNFTLTDSFVLNHFFMLPQISKISNINMKISRQVKKKYLTQK